MHLSEEDIARLIDGKIDSKEKEEFLGHITDCDDCFEVYSEVLKFLESEEERKKDFIIKKIVRQKKIWLPLAAAVLLFVFLLSYFLQKQKTTGDSFWSDVPGKEVLSHIEENISRIEDSPSYGFSPGDLRVKFCVQFGFGVEDLKRLLHSPEVKLKENLVRLLKKGFKQVFNEDLLISGKKIDGELLVGLEKRIETRLAEDSLEDFYSFGKTIERSIFLCMAGKFPDKDSIDQLIGISEKSNFAEKVPVYLRNVKTGENLKGMLKNLRAVRDIFL